MRRSIHAALLAVSTACANLPLPVPAGGTGAPASTPIPASAASDVIRYTNDARSRNGLAALATNAKLMEAARIHAEQMAEHQRDEHTISGARYPTLQSRLQAVGYVYMTAAENVAWNHADARSTVTGWMNSAGHRANILDTRLTQIGAAVARSSRGEPYWIQVFGTPR